MPVEVKQQDCTDSEGRKGDWVVTDGEETFGCHKRRGKAEQQAEAINANREED